MKLWLIKCGKVLNAIRRDGLWHGLAKAVRGLVTTARMMVVPSGDILIITSGIGDSARYRAHHVAEELRNSGLRVSVTVQDNPFLPRYARRFRVFIFHRVLYMGRARALYDAAKATGKTIIFETDDLVYDPAFLAHMDFYNQMHSFERMQYEHGVGGEMVRDPYVKVATTTTSFLAAKLREEGKEVFIVPNKLSARDVARAEELFAQKNYAETETVTIGYFSGVISHNKDFATLTPVLIRLFDTYAQLRIAIYGPLDLVPELSPYADRFVQHVYVPREKHFANVAAVDINIAPLEIGNPFCEAKSELKFFEAGIVGVPTVAAATQTFREAITPGADGFTAATQDEWVSHLGALIESAALRERIGTAARATALRRYTTTSPDAHNTAYEEFLRTAIAGPSL